MVFQGQLTSILEDDGDSNSQSPVVCVCGELHTPFL